MKWTQSLKGTIFTNSHKIKEMVMVMMVVLLIIIIGIYVLYKVDH